MPPSPTERLTTMRITSSISIRVTLIASLIFLALTALLNTVLFAQTTDLIQLSADPYTDSGGQHQSEVEPDSFAENAVIVTAFQVGRARSSGASNIGWAASQNSGTTWASGFLPGITVNQGAGSFERATDPTVAYDAKHATWLIGSLALGASRAVVVSRSTDSGIHWTNPITVASGFYLDKNWLVCDNTPASPFYGNCYMQWNDSIMYMSRSSDGGLTWGSALSPADSGGGLGGQPLVQPSGTVIVPYRAGGSMRAFRSTDGGASWSTPVVLAAGVGQYLIGPLRDFGLPTAEIDGNGTIYVVWPDCRFRALCTANDLVMSRSADGVTWSPVTRIPIDDLGSQVNHTIPGLAVDRTTLGDSAHLALTFYAYAVANCVETLDRLNVEFISSVDGGATWSQPMHLAGPMSLTWLPVAPTRGMVGDYISTSFVNGKAYPFFAVAKAPHDGLLDQAIYTVAGGINIDDISAATPTPTTIPACTIPTPAPTPTPAPPRPTVTPSLPQGCLTYPCSYLPLITTASIH